MTGVNGLEQRGFMRITVHDPIDPEILSPIGVWVTGNAPLLLFKFILPSNLSNLG